MLPDSAPSILAIISSSDVCKLKIEIIILFTPFGLIASHSNWRGCGRSALKVVSCGPGRGKIFSNVSLPRRYIVQVHRNRKTVENIDEEILRPEFDRLPKKKVPRHRIGKAYIIRYNM
jgi:hypothetical protein